MKGRWDRFVHGGPGVAVAVLLPRAASVISQWILSSSAGPAAVTTYVLTTVRASVVVTLVAVGLTSSLAHRARLLGGERGRAVVAAALMALGATGGVVSAAVALIAGDGARSAASAAFVGFFMMLGCVGALAWPIWQLRGRFLRLMLVSVAISVGLAFAAASLGLPHVTTIVVNVGTAVPMLAMVGRVQIRRALRVAVLLARRSISPSLVNFATAAIALPALDLAVGVLGREMMGIQALCWTTTTLLSILSQSLAGRAIAAAALSGVDGEGAGGGRALRLWLRTVPLLALGGLVFYVFFIRALPYVPRSGFAREALPATFFISILVPVLSDPICFFFAPPRAVRRALAGSVVSGALVAGVLLLWPTWFLPRFGIYGASALLAALRMAFVVEPAPLRKVALVMLAIALVAYGAVLLSAGAVATPTGHAA
jgi:hypothetical protein